MIDKLFKEGKSNLSKRSIAVIEIQVLIVLMVFSAFLYAFVDFWVFVLMQGFFVLVYLFVLFKGLLKEVEEKKAYLVFFLVLMVLVEAAAFSSLVASNSMLRYPLISGLIVALLVYVVLFRLVLGKGYTFGVVLMCDGKGCLVHTEFDILAFTNSGKFMVSAQKSYEKGQKVKLRVRQGFFSRKPVSVVE